MQEALGKMEEAKQGIIDGILSELPSDSSIIVDLPSESKFYKTTDSSLPITLRPMTFEDEKAIISQKNVEPINALLSRCLSNVNVEELFPMDKFYLIMKLREISYGDDYKVLLLCPECAAENQVTVYLSKLVVNPVPDDFEDPREVMLPGIKKLAKVRSARVKDEKYLKTREDTLNQLWRLVISIDGQTDRQIVAEVINKLPIKDVKTIINTIQTDFGVETKVKLECKGCTKQSIHDLPLDINFFGVS